MALFGEWVIALRYHTCLVLLHHAQRLPAELITQAQRAPTENTMSRHQLSLSKSYRCSPARLPTPSAPHPQLGARPAAHPTLSIVQRLQTRTPPPLEGFRLRSRVLLRAKVRRDVQALYLACTRRRNGAVQMPDLGSPDGETTWAKRSVTPKKAIALSTRKAGRP